MKKRVLLGLCAALCLGAGAYFNLRADNSRLYSSTLIRENIEASAINLDEGGSVNYTCRCEKFGSSNCAVNNRGKECAPEGTAQCWEYKRNCQKN